METFIRVNVLVSHWLHFTGFVLLFHLPTNGTLKLSERWMGRFYVLISFPNVIGAWIRKLSASKGYINKTIHPLLHLGGPVRHCDARSLPGNGKVVGLVQHFWKAIWQYTSKFKICRTFSPAISIQGFNLSQRCNWTNK